MHPPPSHTCPRLPLLGVEVLLNDFYSTSQEQISIFARAPTIRPLNWESSGWRGKKKSTWTKKFTFPRVVIDGGERRVGEV